MCSNRNFNHGTCPICRAKVRSTDDTWVLTEKPDAAEMAYETTEYLMGLTERSGVKARTGRSDKKAAAEVAQGGSGDTLSENDADTS